MQQPMKQTKHPTTPHILITNTHAMIERKLCAWINTMPSCGIGSTQYKRMLCCGS